MCRSWFDKLTTVLEEAIGWRPIRGTAAHRHCRIEPAIGRGR
jgi:hypothetical protein